MSNIENAQQHLMTRKKWEKMPKGCTEIIDGKLWVGSGRDALDEEQLRALKITHMLNVAAEWRRSVGLFDFIQYSFEPLYDVEDQALDADGTLDRCHKFIDDALSSSLSSSSSLPSSPRVLVHCIMGRSRSVSVLATFMIKYLQTSLFDSVALIRERREVISINDGFARQLMRYECACRPQLDGKSTLADSWTFGLSKQPRSKPTKRVRVRQPAIGADEMDAARAWIGRLFESDGVLLAALQCAIASAAMSLDERKKRDGVTMRDVSKRLRELYDEHCSFSLKAAMGAFPPLVRDWLGAHVDVSAISSANEVMPRLYIGSRSAVADSNARWARGTLTHIVRLLDQMWMHSRYDGIEYLSIEVADCDETDLGVYFEQTAAFIRDALASSLDSAVLVHCAAGMSRSATIMIAYLMIEHGMSLARALYTVRLARPIVEPNDGFMKQLGQLEQTLDAERKQKASESSRAAASSSSSREQ
jgi:protein-tyrosine phosphatase